MLYVYCEGQTEAFYVARDLNPRCLALHGRAAIPVPANGLRPFGHVLRELKNLLRNPQARVTTLIDYYGMPADYPGMPHRRLPSGNRAAVYGEVTRLEGELAKAVQSPRFIPYYALHEFESLAFADPAAVDEQLRRIGGRSVVADVERMIREADGNAELVNDSVATSPSHRLAALWPKGQYQKSKDGLGIVGRIEYPELRARCRHFSDWITRLLA